MLFYCLDGRLCTDQMKSRVEAFKVCAVVARVSFSVLDGGAGVHRDIEMIATESSKTKPTMTTGDGVGG